MSFRSIIWTSHNFLSCASCLPKTVPDVIVCLTGSGKIQGEGCAGFLPGTFSAQLTAYEPVTNQCGQTFYRYTFSYDDSILVPGENIFDTDINQAFCEGCLTDWTREEIIRQLQLGQGVLQTQTAHGFGNAGKLIAVYFDSMAPAKWKLAIATSSDTAADFLAVVIDDNSFELLATGFHYLEDHGLVALDSWYALSRTTPGALVPTSSLLTLGIVQNVAFPISADCLYVEVLEPVTECEDCVLIEQEAHGFTLPSYGVLPIRWDEESGLWVLAQADSADDAAQLFVIIINDVNSFTIAEPGTLYIPDHGLVVGEDYYLSDTVPGTLVLAADLAPSACRERVLTVTTEDCLLLQPCCIDCGGGSTSTALPGTADGRFTLTSGVPVTTADVIGATTIYYSPYIGNHLSLYNGATWEDYTFPELPLPLGTLIDATNYDVFSFPNAGVPDLEISAPWANDTTPTDALVRIDGILLKAADTTRRYLGTFRTTSTTTTEDSAVKRFVSNAVNRVSKVLEKTSSVNTWTYAIAAWRQANADAANQVEVVCGVPAEVIEICVSCFSEGNEGFAAVASNTTTALNGGQPGYVRSAAGQINGNFFQVPRIGYSYFPWIEYARSGLVNFYGNVGEPAVFGDSGLRGQFWC